MVENDNEKFYIGEVLSDKEIDEQIRYIYDLMTANGGEGSGIDADKLDGHHASDFAKSGIEDLIHICLKDGLHIGETTIFSDKENYLTSNDIDLSSQASSRNGNLTAKIYELENAIAQIDTSIFVQKTPGYGLISNESSMALNFLIGHINNYVTSSTNNTVAQVLNADSVNGLTFTLITQTDYDKLTDEAKNNWHNVYIIKDKIDGNYNAPTLLGSGQTLKFRVKDDYIEYCINDTNWISLINMKDVFTLDLIKSLKGDVNPREQDDYPFILATPDAYDVLSNGIKSINFDSYVFTNNNNNIDLSYFFNTYFVSKVFLDSKLKDKEDLLNKKSIINIGSTDDDYPTAKCVYDNLEKKADLEHIHPQITEDIKNTNDLIVKSQTLHTFNVSKHWDLCMTNVNRETSKIEILKDNTHIIFTRIGNVVQFSCYFEKMVLTPNVENEEHTICYIPEGYRPAVSHYIFSNNTYTTVNDSLLFRVNGSTLESINKGNIDVIMKWGANLERTFNGCGFFATWLTSDVNMIADDGNIIDTGAYDNTNTPESAPVDSDSKTNTKISFIGDKNIYQYWNLYGKLTDKDNKALANQKISISLANLNNKNISKTYGVVTNSNGVFSLPMDLTPRSIYATVQYAGDKDYNSSKNEQQMGVGELPIITDYATSFIMNSDQASEPVKSTSNPGYRKWSDMTLDKTGSDIATCGTTKAPITAASGKHPRPADVIKTGWNLSGLPNDVIIHSITCSWYSIQDATSTSQKFILAEDQAVLSGTDFSLNFGGNTISSSWNATSHTWTRAQASDKSYKLLTSVNNLKNSKLLITYKPNTGTGSGILKLKMLKLSVQYIPVQPAPI